MLLESSLEPATESAKLAIFSGAQPPVPPFDSFCCHFRAPPGRHQIWTGYYRHTDELDIERPFLGAVAIVWDEANPPRCVARNLQFAGSITHASKFVILGDMDCALQERDRNVALHAVRKNKNNCGEIKLHSGEVGFVASTGIKGLRYDGIRENWGMLFEYDLEQELDELDGWTELRLTPERLAAIRLSR